MKLKGIVIACALAAAAGAGACAPSERVVVRESYPAYLEIPDPPPRPRPARERKSRVPAMAAGGLAGALLGGWIGASACDELNDTDQECSDRTVEGALLGGGVGVLVGTIVGN